MQKVFVLDKKKRPLMPCHPARARKLLKAGRAVVVRRVPFVIRLKDRTVEESGLQPVRLKIDPGSKVTGIAIIREGSGQAQVLHLAELRHKITIKEAMDTRRNYRRRRRSANLRYRPPRFYNRAASRREGLKQPSLLSRVQAIGHWIARYRKMLPIIAISLETARFDTQKMQNPEITGIEYQQGELYGYELKEYLLEKWSREWAEWRKKRHLKYDYKNHCVYCDRSNVPLNIEHIVPKAMEGSDRVSNLTIACPDCNQKKGAKDIKEFLAHDPKRLKWILSKRKAPLKDVAVINSIRKELNRIVFDTGLPVEVSTGGRTKFNRINLRLPKCHVLDALCVGASTPEQFIDLEKLGVLIIKACGRGERQMLINDAHGFPRRGYKPRRRQKRINGFGTGDLVCKTKGKDKGTSGKLVASTKSPYFYSQNKTISASYRRIKLLQRFDGYGYSFANVPDFETEE